MSAVRFAALAATALVLAACSEAVDDGDQSGSSESSMACDPAGSDGSGPGQGGDDGSSSSDGTGDGPGSGASTGAGGDAAGLVINELSAAGDDWIELFNAGSDTLDVGGLLVADIDDAGAPKVDGAVTIPAGTTLEAGAYLFVLADQDASLPDLQDACDPGPVPCLHAGFGLSGGGDTVFVLDADGAVLASVEYPADATVEGESWGRIPNGTGDFGVTAPTPGAANAAP